LKPSKKLTDGEAICLAYARLRTEFEEAGPPILFTLVGIQLISILPCE
jgi:hypothetical protein